MFSRLKYPRLDVHGFLERAFLWLDSGIDIGIFYAALDLRFAFEKTLIKHGFASDNFTKSFEKLKWQPRKLHEALRWTLSIDREADSQIPRENGPFRNRDSYFRASR